MQPLLRLTAAAAAALAVASCATTMTVSSHVRHGIDFSQYRTYDWGPADALPTGDPRLDENPFFKDHVQGNLERYLAARGFELAASGSPDLLIHYHANISDRIDVNRLDRRYGYCVAGDCPTGIIEYEAGTLVVDIIDARTDMLLWRGWAQNAVKAMLNDPDVMAKTIAEAVRQMMARLPPRL